MCRLNISRRVGGEVTGWMICYGGARHCLYGGALKIYEKGSKRGLI